MAVEMRIQMVSAAFMLPSIVVIVSIFRYKNVYIKHK